MRKLLFVEDHPELIDETVEIIGLLHPDWQILVAMDIEEAWEAASRTTVDKIIIDVMLPTVVGTPIPPKSEGIYLALWFLQLLTPPKWNPLPYKPEVVILTARGKAVEDEIRSLTMKGRKDTPVPCKVISRLDGNPYEHANTICYFPR